MGRRIAAHLGVLICFGMLVSASTLSGHWKMDCDLTIAETIAFPEFIHLRSEFATEFHLDGWTFASITFFDSLAGISQNAGLNRLKVASAGSLGTFDVISSMTFNVAHSYVVGFSAVRTVIGGLDLWAAGVLLSPSAQPLCSTGLVLGAFGTVGNVEYYTDIAFNMEGIFCGPFIVYGLDAMWERLMLCDTLLGTAGFSGGIMPFSYINVYTKAQLDCFDVETWTRFWGVMGFESFHVWISDVDLGFGGLRLDEFRTVFRVDQKMIYLDLGVRLAESVCITPYVSLMHGSLTDPDVHQSQIEGVSVDALELTYTVGDVTFIASEILREHDAFPLPVGPIPAQLVILGSDARIHAFDWHLGWFIDCFTPVFANGAIGIEIQQVGCCDSLLTLGLYGFFDTHASSSLFDWTQTRMTMEYERLSNLVVSGSLNIDDQYGVSLGMTFELLWGELVIFGSGWEEACCRVWQVTI